MLKAELHAHVRGYPKDNIKYSARHLIDRAAELNFNVLGITNHNRLYNEPGIKEYAASKNIILLLGVELSIHGKHTLIYNITEEQLRQIRNLNDLTQLKQEHPEILIIAPHPFHYGSNCHQENILRHFSLFDSWEYSFFHCQFCNPNKKTLALAKKYHKPMVGCSDIHWLRDLGKTYTLIAAESKEKDIFAAIRKGYTQVVTRPLSISRFVNIGLQIVLNSI